WQHSQGRAHQVPIQKILVGKSRFCVAPPGGLREVLDAEAVPVLSSRIEHPRRECQSTATCFRIDHISQVINLVCALDIRVRRQDLLDQCRSGTWKTDD